MKGHGPVTASASLVNSSAWTSGARIIRINRGGYGPQSGNGPQGYKAQPRALLARSLRDRPGVAAAATARQAAAVARRNSPPKVIYGP